ncbi:unnamed protein product [Microthlaspi erraticum]|uniref:Uncharacterized protein n=1 Tax=Microthlaspi erraticum TaxID=1685480 RepID=A0A6D2IAK8_9BRAS|nr:unnamed protein product [Microthlaspi erraticum]
MLSSPRLKLFHTRPSLSRRRSSAFIVFTSLAIGGSLDSSSDCPPAAMDSGKSLARRTSSYTFEELLLGPSTVKFIRNRSAMDFGCAHYALTEGRKGADRTNGMRKNMT